MGLACRALLVRPASDCPGASGSLAENKLGPYPFPVPLPASDNDAKYARDHPIAGKLNLFRARPILHSFDTDQEI